MEILLACRVMENFQQAKTAASGLDYLETSPCRARQGAPKGCERQSLWIWNRPLLEGCPESTNTNRLIDGLSWQIFLDQVNWRCPTFSRVHRTGPHGSKVSYDMRTRLAKVRLRRENWIENANNIRTLSIVYIFTEQFNSGFEWLCQHVVTFSGWICHRHDTQNVMDRM